jgi:hypothetical protein
MSVDTLARSASSDLVLRPRRACLAMKMPKIDDKLRLQADFGETDAICVEVLKNPATEEGILLKVMDARPIRTRPAGLDSRSRWIENRRCG